MLSSVVDWFHLDLNPDPWICFVKKQIQLQIRPLTKKKSFSFEFFLDFILQNIILKTVFKTVFGIRFILMWIRIRPKINIFQFFFLILITMFFFCCLWAYYSCILNKIRDFFFKKWYSYNLVDFYVSLSQFFFDTRIQNQHFLKWIRFWIQPNDTDPKHWLIKRNLS